MRKIALLAVMGALISGLLTSPEMGEDAKSIIEKMIDASGGRQALEGIKDTTISGEMEILQMGMNGSMTMHHKEPNKFRQDMEIMGMVITNAFDGEVAWMINPQTGSVEEMSGEMLEESRKGALEFGNSAVLYPEKYGITNTLQGKETIDGNEYFIVAQKFANDDTNTLYIDAETYLLHAIKQRSYDMAGSTVDQELIFSDYKKVEGIMFAHTMTVFQNGEEFGILTVSEIKFNSGLEDSLFEMEK